LQSKVREKELFTQALLSAIPNPVFYKDAKGRYLGCNNAFTEVMGVTAEEIRGKTVYELWPGEHARIYHRKDLELLRHPARQVYEFKVRDKDGCDRPVIYAKDVFRDENGAAAGIVGAFMDITERKRMEEDRQRLFEAETAARLAAEESNRSKDQFLAIVSHELRTPLTGMLGWTWLLRNKSLDSVEARGALDSIADDIKALSKIVEELLDVTHLLSGKMTLERRVLGLSEVLRAAADAARPAAAARRVRLVLPPAAPAARVLGDAGRLQQVFGNLLDNAIRFSKKGQAVRVGLSAKGAAVRVTVTDSGAGIAPRFLERMYAPFLQAEDALTREHGGLGVGLAIVRRLVELHGGSISASSRGPGRGSRFTVAFPVVPPEAA